MFFFKIETKETVTKSAVCTYVNPYRLGIKKYCTTLKKKAKLIMEKNGFGFPFNLYDTVSLPTTSPYTNVIQNISKAKKIRNPVV